jgi:hypothetical protein
MNTTTMTAEELQAVQQMKAELEALRNKNADLAGKLQAKRKISFKVGEKGGVSVYGLNVRFPVTLYKEQWERLLNHADQLRAFMQENASKLSVKEE